MMGASMLDGGSGVSSIPAGSKPAGIPYKAVLIRGAKLMIHDDIREQFSKEKEGYLLIGDGETELGGLDLSKLQGNIGEHTRIYSSAHGGFEGSVYYVDNLPASEFLKKIAAANPTMPLNFEFYACQSGAAAYSVAELPIGSVLVTHGGVKDSTMADLNYKTIQGSSKDLASHTNQVEDFASRFALHVKQTATISIRKPDGEVFKHTTRPPRRFLIDPEEVIRYLEFERTRFVIAYNQQCTPRIDPDTLPAITLEEATEWRNDFFHYMLRLGDKKLLEAINATPEKFSSFVNCLSESLTTLLIAINSNAVEQVAALTKVPGIDLVAKDKNGISPLMLAASLRYIEIIEVLKGVKGIDPNDTIDGFSILMIAVLNAEVKVVKALKGFQNIDANERNKSGDTLLMLAAARQYTHVIKELKEFTGIDANARDSNGNTVLMLSALNRRIDVINELKNFPGINPNAKDQNGNTVLMLAAASKLLNVIEALKTFPSIDANARDSNGNTVLMLAAAQGNVAVINALRNFPGIDPNARDNNGKTALMLAVAQGNVAVINALQNFPGIDLAARDNNGDTVLKLAIAQGNVAVIRALKNFPGIDLNIKDSNGRTVFQNALEGMYVDVVEELISFPGFTTSAIDLHEALILAAKNRNAGVIKVIMNIPGFVPSADDLTAAFFQAAQNGSVSVIKILMSFEGIDLNARDSNGETALILAAKNGHSNVIQAILNSSDFILNVEDLNKAIQLAKENNHVNVGQEILMWIAGKGNIEVINALKEFPGINPNALYYTPDDPFSEGFTALYLAAAGGHADVINALKDFPGFAPDINDLNTSLVLAAQLRHAGVINALKGFSGIDPNFVNGYGDTALTIAVERGNVEVINALKGFPGIDPNFVNGNGDTALISAARNGSNVVIELLKCFPMIEVPETLPKYFDGEVVSILESFKNDRKQWLRQNGVEDAEEKPAVIHARESLKTHHEPHTPRGAASHVEALENDRPAVFHTAESPATTHLEAVKAIKDQGKER